MGVIRWFYSGSGRGSRAAYFSTVAFLLSIWLLVSSMLIPICVFLFIPGVPQVAGFSKPDIGILKVMFVICMAVCLSCVYSVLCVTSKRLHDTGRKGIHALWLFVPVIGILILLPVLIKKTQDATNKHGVAPSKDTKSFVNMMGGFMIWGSLIGLFMFILIFAAVFSNVDSRVRSYTGLGIKGYVSLYKDRLVGIATKNDRDWEEWKDEKQESFLAGKIPTDDELSKAIFGIDYGENVDKDALTDEVMDIIIVYVAEGAGGIITKDVIGYDNLSIRRRAAYLIASCLYDGTLISESDIERSATEQAIGEAVDYVYMISKKQ